MRRTRTTWTTTLAGGGLALTLLAGCGAAADEPTAAEGADAEAAATHTMDDGTVMSGAEHPDDDSGQGGGNGEPAADEGQDGFGPSEAATMICGGAVADDVARLTGIDDLPEPSSTWQAPTFRCTFELPAGPLVLSVHDVDDLGKGKAHFAARRKALAPVEELKGMYGLGLPAFETNDGIAAFIREGKTLEVDATALPGSLGPDGTLDQADLAYAVATSVLACWTEHA